MDNQTSVMFCGFGGQGIVMAGMILGQAGVFDGLNVAQAASYGSEARGSACRSEVVLSNEPIIYPHVSKVDVIGAMSQAGYDKFHSHLKNDSCFLMYDESMVEPDKSKLFSQTGFPVTDAAIKKLDKKITANIIFLAAMVEKLNIVSKASLEKSIRKNVPAKFLELNLKAMEIGMQMGADQV